MMLGQCPQCRGMFEIQPEWAGRQAQCPYCGQNIVIQPGGKFFGRPVVNPHPGMPSPSSEDGKSTGSLVCGILSLILWLLPIIGLPLSITGLILGLRKKYSAGMILNGIGLVLSVINAVVGAVLAVKRGGLF